MFLSKLTNWYKRLIKEKLIIIPLVRDGKPTGQWVECRKGDDTYIKLLKLYGHPLPEQIEVVPYKGE
jgi:hypothetical protein